MIAIIPARKGSKRLPGKNMMELCGKPLIYWTIVAAKTKFQNEHIIVSSDSKEILDYAMEQEVVARGRPKHLATDEATTFDVVFDIVVNPNCDVMVLQPTSPLRTSEDIVEAARVAQMGGEWGGVVRNNTISLTTVCDSIYRPNGAVYVVKGKDIAQRNAKYELAYIMPPERSIDIDTIEDFKEAERLMNERNKL